MRLHILLRGSVCNLRAGPRRDPLCLQLLGVGGSRVGPGMAGESGGLPPAAARPPRARLPSAKASACAAPSLRPRGRNSRPPFFSIHPHPTPAACSPCSSGGGGIGGGGTPRQRRPGRPMRSAAWPPAAPPSASLSRAPRSRRRSPGSPRPHGPSGALPAASDTPTYTHKHTHTYPAGPDPRPSRPQPLPFQEARTRSRAAGAAQAVTQGGGGDGGGRSGRRRREQMALKETREPAASAHIQLASARRAAPPPSSPRPLASASPSNGRGRRARALLPSNRAVLLLPGSPRLPARVGPLLAAHPSGSSPLPSAVGWRSQTHCDDPGSPCPLG